MNFFKECSRFPQMSETSAGVDMILILSIGIKSKWWVKKFVHITVSLIFCKCYWLEAFSVAAEVHALSYNFHITQKFSCSLHYWSHIFPVTCSAYGLVCIKAIRCMVLCAMLPGRSLSVRAGEWRWRKDSCFKKFLGLSGQLFLNKNAKGDLQDIALSIPVPARLLTLPSIKLRISTFYSSRFPYYRFVGFFFLKCLNCVLFFFPLNVDVGGSCGFERAKFTLFLKCSCITSFNTPRCFHLQSIWQSSFPKTHSLKC